MNGPIIIILPASEVPLGARVSKATAIRSRSVDGPKVYILRDRVRVFDADGSRREIVAPGGTRFLIHQDGDINGVEAATQLLWHTDRSTLLGFLARDPYRDDPFEIDENDDGGSNPPPSA